MKYIKITCCVILLYILLIPCGCSETDQVQESDEMLITFDMQHPALARATTSAFEKDWSIHDRTRDSIGGCRKFSE